MALVEAAGDDFTNALQAALDADLVDEALELCCRARAVLAIPGLPRHAHEQLLDRTLALAEKHAVRSATHADALTWSAGLGLRLRIMPDRERMVGRLHAWARSSLVPSTAKLPSCARTVVSDDLCSGDGRCRRRYCGG